MKTNWSRVLGAVLLAGMGLVSATPRLVFDGSEMKFQKPVVSAPELAALKRLYARKRVNICEDFEVRTRQNGRFTAHRTQTLYLVQNCYNDAAANTMRTRWMGDLLILDGTRLNFFKAAFTDYVNVLPSLDGSGLNALLTETLLGPHMGEFASTGQLYVFRGGAFQPLLNLGRVYLNADKFNAGPEVGTASRRVLWYDPARPNWLKLEEFASPYTAKPGRYDAGRARKTLSITMDLRHPPKGQPWQSGED